MFINWKLFFCFQDVLWDQEVHSDTKPNLAVFMFRSRRLTPEKGEMAKQRQYIRPSPNDDCWWVDGWGWDRGKKSTVSYWQQHTLSFQVASSVAALLWTDSWANQDFGTVAMAKAKSTEGYPSTTPPLQSGHSLNHPKLHQAKCVFCKLRKSILVDHTIWWPASVVRGYFL